MTRLELARRCANRPLAFHPTEAELLRSMLRGEMAMPVQAFEDVDDRVGLKRTADRDRLQMAGPVAVIRICGSLWHGGGDWWWGGSTYDSMRAQLAAAIDDSATRAVALHINSPGGEVAGCFDLADAVFDMRGEKPIWAILDENAFSAAYALACAADHVTVPRTGGTGSIGVVSMHVDITGMLDKAGVKVTTFQFGARKTDGYPTTPMSDEARDETQAEIDQLGGLFVDTVARNRGIAASKVRAMQARCFLGAAGVEAGLADEVLSPDAAFLKLLAQLA